MVRCKDMSVPHQLLVVAAVAERDVYRSTVVALRVSVVGIRSFGFAVAESSRRMVMGWGVSTVRPSVLELEK